jgi:mRNA interferase RelE/StbE
VSGDGGYELVVTPPARLALTDGLREAVAAAVIDLLTTSLVVQPNRVGRQLRGQLDGIWAARRGAYRVLYRITEEQREVIAVRIDHRRDAYRAR